MYPLFGHTLTSLYPSIIQSLTRPSQVRRTANSDWTKIEQTMNVASYPLVVDSSWTLHYNIATYAHAHDFSTCWENIDSKVGKLKGRHGVMDKEWDACWESEVKWSQDVGKLLVWVINGENGDNPWEFCGENIDLLPTFTLSHKGCPAPKRRNRICWMKKRITTRLPLLRRWQNPKNRHVPHFGRRKVLRVAPRPPAAIGIAESHARARSVGLSVSWVRVKKSAQKWKEEEMSTMVDGCHFALFSLHLRNYCVW